MSVPASLSCVGQDERPPHTGGLEMPHPSRWINSSLLVVVLSITACGGSPEQRDWTYFGGDKAFTRYAPLE